jgi:regulation of enolase protein 1 (concanavalin A-like superfamily)
MWLKQTCVFVAPLVLLWSCTTTSFEATDCEVRVGAITFSKSMNEAQQQTVARPGELTLQSGPKTDFFNEPNGKDKYGNAPVLLTPINNLESFTFMTQVTPTFTDTYDAGAVYLFVDDDHWLKLAFEMDERKLTRLVTVRTHGTSDDNNHDAVTAATVWLKVSSNGESIGYYYSVDNITWQLLRVYKNDFPATVWLGLSAQSPLGTGNTAHFAGVSITNTAVADFRKGI